MKGIGDAGGIAGFEAGIGGLTLGGVGDGAGVFFEGI